MPIKSRYVFSASMDVEPAKEALFNEVCTTPSMSPTSSRCPA